MEENITPAIEMAFSVFLFVFALSAAVLSYSRVNATADNLISNNIVSRRGTAVNDQLSDEDMMREADYSEIVLSAFTLERTYQTANNSSYTIQVVNKSGYRYTIGYIPAVYDEFEMEIEPAQFYIDNLGTSLKYNIVGTAGGSAKKFVEDLEDLFAYSGNELRKYNVSFTDTSTIYSEI